MCLLLECSTDVYSQAVVSQSDTVKSILKLNDVAPRPWEQKNSSPFFLNTPSNIKSSVFYDTKKNEYVIYQKVGSFDYRTPIHLSPENYRKYEYDNAMREYWKSRITGREESFRTNLIPQIEIGGETFDKIFGSNIINIVPQGSAELTFGINISHTDNPTLSERLRTITTFDFEEKIQMNISGTIGDKVNIGLNYNTEALFDFENTTKLQYAGDEDEIFTKIEAGNITLPLKGSLITGSYSLFGLKTEMQFGKLTLTSVMSQQKGESSTITVERGAQKKEFKIDAGDYESNRHFFLAQFFRDTYDNSLKTLPTVTSGINIEKIEVWVTNTTSNYVDTRNIVALMDLGEGKRHIYNKIPQFQATENTSLPSNETNPMYEQLNNSYSGIRNFEQVTDILNSISPDFKIGTDYEKIENARQLKPSEYTLNKELGYISLNTALNNDEVLAVAFQFTYKGRVYQVGEFSTDGIDAPKTLILKLIRGTSLVPYYPTWDLMMKNIYSLGSGQLEKDNFELNILYEDDRTGNSVNYLPEGNLHDKILLEVMGLDNLNYNNDWVSDGVFDFIDGVTVLVSRGKIIFPVIEPFGSHLRSKITNPDIADKYVFQELYDSTQTYARQLTEKDKFILSGTFSSEAGSEIYLDAVSIPEGSVVVTAGGVTLAENIDYTVDYTLGTVTIINQSLLESGTAINVTLESNQYFGIQTKTLVGTHLNYQFSKDFSLGGTLLHLNERPYTSKVIYGEEPISNTIWGLDVSYNAKSQLVTNILDKIPLINAKDPSSFSFFGEFAQLLPGHSKAIDDNSYIDDFESSETPIDLTSYSSWSLASIPQGQSLFPEASLNNNLACGFNRAKTAWYVIDPLFLRNGSTTPSYIKNNPDLQSSHFVREIYETEVFPNRESPTGLATTLSILNLAFYPEEKGPYNYDTKPTSFSAGMNAQGRLNNPKSRWGGIMREMLTTDFETANIQYIEFWLMDPFVDDANHSGGDFYINLGNISEDILKDSRKSFENGLPASANIINVDTTAWGRVPTVQSVVDAFDSDSKSRRYQDVGLDGLMDDDERTFFSDYLEEARMIVDADVFNNIQNDPSNDNFHYYRGTDYDVEELGIIERYKNFNGVDGNSPTSEMSKESYTTSGTTIPDIEDIDDDNTLSETENYFQYKISMRPEDLVVGTNFIVDEVEYTATMANGTKSPVKWYQFKIPVSDYTNTVGSISNFQSIRFMRMFLTNFDKPLIMRFAELNLVRAEWRKYNIAFMEGGERITIPESSDATFEISSVSIEENAGKDPVNYVLPPGFDREIDPSNTQLQQLDEQSMVLKIIDLADGDARAAYKTVNLDMRQYRKLFMEVHGEALSGDILNDDDLTVFIRMGSDYKNNFYEYEMPLKLTPHGVYSNKSEAQRAIVWPKENSFKINLSDFQEAKQQRNKKMKEPGSPLSLTDIFIYTNDSGHRISVCGSPNISNVKVIMVGVRNPIRTRDPNHDDGLNKSGEIWINELRLSDFDESSGWAANAQLQANLADIATIDIAGQASSPGWGTLESSIRERSLEKLLKYDISSTIEIGKLFPEKAGVRFPLYIGYSETMVTPEYNPLDPDILMEDMLKNADTKAERDSVLALTQDYTRRKSLNINNAGINRKKEKAYPWDISNISINYMYNEIYNRNTTTEFDMEKNIKGGINYNYEPSPKNIVPFKKVKFLNAPVFKIVKDINFYLLPKSISFRTELERYYNEVLSRNLENPNLLFNPTFNKQFEWSRIFDMQYDLTRQLKFDFSSTNYAAIDEPLGGVDKDRYKSTYEMWKDSVMTNIKTLGSTTSYHHDMNLTYTLPVNKLPALSWISANARYSADYSWLTGSDYPDSITIDIGNKIENSSNMSVTAMANLASLYNKSKFLKRIETVTRPGAAKKMQTEFRTETYTKDNIKLRKGIVRVIIHNLKTESVTVQFTDAAGKEIKGKVNIVNDNRITFVSEENVDNATVTIEGKIPIKRNPWIVTGEYLLRAMMGLRSVSLNYTLLQGQYLPGYMPDARFMGMSRSNVVLAPGLPFITGFSNKKFFDKALENGWLTTDTLQSSAAGMVNQKNISFRSSIEPITGLKIDITADRKHNNKTQIYYIADKYGNFPESTRNETLSGTFSMSVISWGTAFEKMLSSKNYVSPTFEAFKKNLSVISDRRASIRKSKITSYRPGDDLYKAGYSPTSAEVMIPAFLAAYTKTNPSKVTLSTFPNVSKMMPNWRITLDGLTKYDFIQRIFSSLSLSHQYRSIYQITLFNTNMNYVADENTGFTNQLDLSGNFLQPYDINAVTVSEQFSPLINIDMGWKNNLTSRFEWRKTRTVTLSLLNNQVTDARVNELTIGTGYRFDQVSIAIKTGGRQQSFKSDLNVNLDLSIRENKSVARKLVEDVNQPVSGQTVFSANLSADYILSDRFSIQVYVDHSFNKPFVATTYPTSNTDFGFTVKFSLIQ